MVYLRLQVQQLHEGAWVVSSSVTAPTIDPRHVRHKNSSNLPIRLEKSVICLPSLLFLRRGYSMILATRDGMNPTNPHQCLGMDLPGVNLLVSHHKRNASRVCGRIVQSWDFNLRNWIKMALDQRGDCETGRGIIMCSFNSIKMRCGSLYSDEMTSVFK